MSSYGMLGLLEGVGKGATSAGESLQKSIMQQAEERRQMNLLSIERQWDQEDKTSDRTYAEDVKADDRTYSEGVKKDDRTYLEGVSDKEYTRGRTDKKEDQTAEWGHDTSMADQAQRRSRENATFANDLANSNPSAMGRTAQDIKAAVAAGDITPEEGKAAIGQLYSGREKGSITEKDVIGFKVDAAKQAQKEAENAPVGSKTNTPEWKSQRANELVREWMGADGGLLEGGPEAGVERPGNKYTAMLDKLSGQEQQAKDSGQGKPAPAPGPAPDRVVTDQGAGDFDRENRGGGMRELGSLDNRATQLAGKAKEGMKQMETGELRELLTSLKETADRSYSDLSGKIQAEIAHRQKFIQEQERMQGKAIRTF